MVNTHVYSPYMQVDSSYSNFRYIVLKYGSEQDVKTVNHVWRCSSCFDKFSESIKGKMNTKEKLILAYKIFLICFL